MPTCVWHAVSHTPWQRTCLLIVWCPIPYPQEPEAPGARDGSAHHHIGGLEEPDDLASAINRHGEVVLEVGGWGRVTREGRGLG